MLTYALAIGHVSTGWAAEPVLMLDFTPGTANEFAVTVMIQGMVNDRLLADGHIVLSSEVVEPVVGAEAIDNCSGKPGCPNNVLRQLPTRIAVVCRLNRNGEDLFAHMELFEQSNPNPVVVRDIPLAPGQEGALAAEVSAATEWLLGQVGPSSDAVLMAAARLIAGLDPSAAPPESSIVRPPPVVARPPPKMVDVEDSAPTGVPQPQASVVPVVQPPRLATAGVGQLGEETGVYYRHVAGSEEHFKNSGLDPRDWVFEAMPHAGRVIFEMRAGLGLGDTDRGADIRVQLNGDSEVLVPWYQEGPVSARRPRGSIFLGYAPTTFLDVGVLLGLQYGHRQFTTGYARAVPLDVKSSGQRVVDAIQFYVQPRLRAYLVPVGPAKPYLVSGADIRVFDAYDLEQPPNFSYPIPPGGVVPGWIGGAGMLIDPSPIVGFFFEGNYTQHFGPRSELGTTGVWTFETVAPLSGVQYTIGLVGGIQFRI